MSLRISMLTITAVLAAGALPGSAGAAPDTQDLRSPDTRDAADQIEARDFGVTPLQDLRSPDARDAAREFPTYPAAAAAAAPAPAEVAEVAAAPEGSFDWGDAGIGAAMMLALFGIAAGLLLLAMSRRGRPFRPAH